MDGDIEMDGDREGCWGDMAMRGDGIWLVVSWGV